MSRALKFRAFNDLYGMSRPFFLMDGTVEWRDAQDDLFACNDIDGLEALDSLVVQYIGLKDRNGVEIYEGHIVKATIPNDDEPGEFYEYVCAIQFNRSLNLGRFNSEYPASFVLFNEQFWHDESLVLSPSWQYEVIGHMYENPELLSTTANTKAETTRSDVEGDIFPNLK